MRRALCSLEPGGEHGIGGFYDKCIWIELLAHPLDLLGVFGVFGVGKNSHEMLIAPRAAAVLGRTGRFPEDLGGEKSAMSDGHSDGMA